MAKNRNRGILHAKSWSVIATGAFVAALSVSTSPAHATLGEKTSCKKQMFDITDGVSARVFEKGQQFAGYGAYYNYQNTYSNYSNYYYNT